MEVDANPYNIGARSMRTIVSSMRIESSSCDVVEVQVQIDAKGRDPLPKPMRVDAMLYRFEVDTNLSKIGGDPCAKSMHQFGSAPGAPVSWWCPGTVVSSSWSGGVPVASRCYSNVFRQCPANVWVVSWWCPSGVPVISQWCPGVVSMVSQ